MNIKSNKNNEILEISLEGRLDTNTAPELDEFIKSNLDGVSSLKINCEELVYISSAGLRVLLAAHKRFNGAMKLSCVGELVMEVFEMTGFADILDIEK